MRRSQTQAFGSANVHPTFETNVTFENGFPHVVTFRPVITADGLTPDDEIMLVTGLFIRTYLTELVAAIPGWSEERARENISGYLSATTNEVRYCSKRINHLRSLNRPKLESLYADIVQSNLDLIIGDITWGFTFNISIFSTGSGDAKKPAWWGKQIDFSWKNHVDAVGQIACAAVAITLAKDGIDQPPGQYYRGSTGLNRLVTRSRDLQSLLGWDTNVGLNNLKDFVLKFPKYRLTCFLPHEKVAAMYTFVGTEYDHSIVDSNRRPKYALYIYLDIDQGHYACVRGPTNFFRLKNNHSHFMFCHTCLIAFRGAHECNEVVRAPPARVKDLHVCKKCGTFGTHNCSLVECGNCKAVFPKRGADLAHKHRCVLYEEKKDEEGYNCGENDGKKPSLWVYDLESRITRVNLPTFVNEPVFDGEMYYTGVIDNSKTSVDEQIANFVFATNVFTGQELEYFGDSCLDDFLTFLLNHNKGVYLLIRKFYLFGSQCFWL